MWERDSPSKFTYLYPASLSPEDTMASAVSLSRASETLPWNVFQVEKPSAGRAMPLSRAEHAAEKSRKSRHCCMERGCQGLRREEERRWGELHTQQMEMMKRNLFRV
jgi:hypothetical protein